jgi:hypothetical protein
MSSRNRQYAKRRRDGKPVDQSSVVKLKASETDGFSRRAEKAVGRLSRVTEQGTVDRSGRMVGALCAMAGSANRIGVLPGPAIDRGSARAHLNQDAIIAS